MSIVANIFLYSDKEMFRIHGARKAISIGNIDGNLSINPHIHNPKLFGILIPKPMQVTSKAVDSIYGLQGRQ